MAETPTSQTQLHFVDLSPKIPDIRQTVHEGLTAHPKSLPPWLLYDPVGSELFHQITDQPEYYPTRSELKLLAECGATVSEFIGDDALIVELGGSSGRKIRALLASISQPVTYMPVDIDGKSLRASAQAVFGHYERVSVHGVCADFTQLEALPLTGVVQGKVLFFFPGSTIGNFEPPVARQLLKSMAQVARSGGGALIGVDLKKNPATLHAAYNDEKGATARFELNVLQRLNRELGAGFVVEDFRYEGTYCTDKGRVEMRLRAVRPTHAMIAGTRIEFIEGETIELERSYKYGLEGFQAMARECGLEPQRVWVDQDTQFSVHLLRSSL